MRPVLKVLTFLPILFIFSLLTSHPPAHAAVDVTTVIQGIQAAHGAGATPIIRMGVAGDSGGFSNPADYVIFLKAIDSQAGGLVYAIAGPNEPESETWATPNCQVGDAACIGPGVAAYMNAVIAGAGHLTNVKLLSPAFNLCSPVFPSLISAMGGANFGGLSGYAVNAYNGAPAGAESLLSTCINDRIGSLPGGLPIIITETGAFNGDINSFASQLAAVTSNGRIKGALLFNAFNTNPGWSQFSLSDPQINTACQNSCGSHNIGVNFATPYTHGNYSKAGNLGMKYTLEIAVEGGVSTPPPQTPPDNFTRLQYPCNKTTPDEYHPLRPYPFSPCDPFIPKKDNLTFQCGNAVNISGSLPFPAVTQDQLNSLSPMDPTSISETAIPWDSNSNTGLYKCTNASDKVCAIQRLPFNITVDLSPAQLPVIGFTQGNLDDPSKVNNYLSWYLNGTVQQSEHQPLDANNSADVSRLINFSGPIKKLLSQTTQDALRYTVYYQGGGDIHNYLISNQGTGGNRLSGSPPSTIDLAHFRDLLSQILPNVPLSSFEDVVGEVIVSVIPSTHNQGQPSNPGPYLNPLSETPNYDSKNSLTLHISHTPVLGQPYSDGRLYFPHVRETAFLSDVLKSYANPLSSNSLYPLPTEAPLSGGDQFNSGQEYARRRIFALYDKNAHKGTQDDTVVQVVWGEGGWGSAETPTRNTEIVDNLNQIPNKNIVVKKGDPYTFPPNQIDSLGNAPAPTAPIEVTRGNSSCNLDPMSVSIPGDNLVDKNGLKIRARLTYTGVFQWQAIPNPTYSGSCRNDQPNLCGPSPWYSCHTSSCSNQGQFIPGCDAHVGTCGLDAHPITLPTAARVAVTTESPFLRKIYESLISSSQSVLRRFLPAKDPQLNYQNTCDPTEYLRGENITLKEVDNPEFDPINEAVPGWGNCIRNVVTSANYSYGSGTATADHPNVPNGSGSTTAHIYIPYLGSLYDYFLGAGGDSLNLQRMLRPQGMSSTTTNSTSPNQPPSINCQVPQSGYCSVSALTPAFGSNANAFSWICQRESSGYPAALNTNCLQGSAKYTRDYSVGLFQINMLAHPSLTWLNNSPDAAGLRAGIVSLGLNPGTTSCYNALQENFSMAPPYCSIINSNLLNLCVTWFQNPQNNIAYASWLYSTAGWSPWGGQPSCNP